MKVLNTSRHEKAGQTGQVFSLFRPSRLPVICHASAAGPSVHTAAV